MNYRRSLTSFCVYSLQRLLCVRHSFSYQQVTQWLGASHQTTAQSRNRVQLYGVALNTAEAVYSVVATTLQHAY